MRCGVRVPCAAPGLEPMRHAKLGEHAIVIRRAAIQIEFVNIAAIDVDAPVNESLADITHTKRIKRLQLKATGFPHWP